jgi:hypothetical protein
MLRSLAVLALPLLGACATTSSSSRAASTARPSDSPLWRPVPLGAPRKATQTDAAARVDLDSSEELFDCLTTDACPAAWEDRAKRRASIRWLCPTSSIVAAERPTAGLYVPGSRMAINPQGRAEYHATPGVKGDAAFVLMGCARRGIIACIPAHRSVVTATQTFDDLYDHLCLWARDSE